MEDTKYRPSDKLTVGQRKEIAHLANAGVPHKVLAEGYGVSVATVSSARRKVGELIGDDSIARTPEEKFAYAQKIYGSEFLSEEGRSYINTHVFEPVAKTAAFNYKSPERPMQHLLAVVFGKEPRSVDSSELENYALEVLQQGALQGVIYEDSGKALEGVNEAMRFASNAHFRIGEKERTNELEGILDEALDTLNLREREVVKLRYGLSDGTVYTLDEVGKRFEVTRERVRQIEAKAVRKFQHPIRYAKLIPAAIALTHAEDLETKVEEERVAQERLRVGQEVRVAVLSQFNKEHPEYGLLEEAFDSVAISQNPAYQTKISELELSIRAKNVLNRAGVETIGDLTMHSEAELLSYANFGEQQLQEIKRELSSRGANLKGEASERVTQAPYQALLGVPEIPIQEAGLAIRARLGLEELGILTLNEATEFTARDLLEKSPRIGRTSLRHIEETLAEYGLSLKKKD